MREIPLTRGKFAIVDDEDFELLNQYKWHYLKTGYAARRLLRADGHGYVLMHSVIITHKEGLVIDHISSDKLDNRKCNLRICTQQQNVMNSRKLKTTCSSKYKGVCWNSGAGKWMAYITCNAKRIHLGLFITEETAAHVYDEKARELFGEYACTNFQ